MVPVFCECTRMTSVNLVRLLVAVTVIVYVCKFSVLCDLFEDDRQQGTGTEHYEYSRETLLFLQTVKNSLVDHPFNDS